MSGNKSLSSKERKQLAKQRKDSAKQAQEFHKKQKKKAERSSAPKKKKPSGKIEKAVNSNPNRNAYENISREEKYRRESEERIRNLRPHDFEDGYYIDEYGARKKQERRAKEIRKQENEVIRRNKKPLTRKQIRRKRILISVGIILAVLVIGAILSLTVLFKTEKIDVEGDEYYYDDQIIAFSNVNLQQNIFIAAFGGTSDKIVENLPYVEKAEIGFAIPDTVTIKITDAVPSYVIKDGNNYLLISSKGRILDTLTENSDNLPELTCGELKSKEVGDYVSFSDDNVPDILQEVAESLKNNDVEKITGFDVTDTANITLDYDGRIKINIGLPEDIDYKIRTAMTIINEKLDPNNTGTISGTLDVSTCNTNKMSHYKPSPTTAPATTEPTSAATTAAESYSDNNYYWDGNTANDYSNNYGDYSDNNGYYGDTNSYNNNYYGYDNSYGNGYYGDNNSYSNGDYYADGGYYGNDNNYYGNGGAAE